MTYQSKIDIRMNSLKKNIKRFGLVTAFLVAGFVASAQIRQANSLFNQFKYSKAIPLYQKASEDKDIKIRKEATARLADCYRLMNNANEARSWYAKAVTFEGADPINYYYLGMALRTLANYDEAESAFQEYAGKVPSDFRGKVYAGYCREIKTWEGLTSCAEIKDAVTLNSPYSDFGPTFYQDGLIFTSDRDIDMITDKNYLWTSFGYLDLYEARPVSYNDFWSDLKAPERLPATFNQAYHDGPVSFTGDFRKMFITRTLKNSSKKDTSAMKTDYLKIFIADLNGQKKIDFIPFPYNAENYSVGHPSVSKDGKTLILSSNKPGGSGQSDLYISELKDGKWSEPENLGPEINTFGNEVFPFLANDSTLYFSSDGLPGYGGLDLYETNKVNGKWLKPWNLKAPLNSPYDDFSIAFDKKQSYGFFSSNRPGGVGSDDIYAFRNYRRTLGPNDRLIIGEKNKKLVLAGFVKDKKNMEPIEGATVFLLNSTTNEVLILKTDKKGYYETPADNGVLYVAKAMSKGYFDDCLNFRIPDGKTSEKSIALRDLLLDKYALNQVFVVQNIYYDLDKWAIRDDAKPSLDQLARLLKQYPISVELGSHTDSRASADYNIELSQRRAESVVRYLILSGINPARLTARGYGETRLVNKCADGVPCTEAEHQANRRTEFRITSIDGDEKGKKSFDPGVFKAGDKVPVQILDPEFFSGCLEAQALNEQKQASPEPEETLAGKDSNSSVWYSVQLAASVKQVKPEPQNFKGLAHVQERKIGKYFKYFEGHFSGFDAAAQECETLKVKFPGAFVVAIDGEKVERAVERKK